MFQSAAGMVAVELISLPIMFSRGYDKRMALGPIAAGGTLGQLIPASVLFIFYSSLTGASVAALFKARLYAGTLMGAIFVIYIPIRGYRILFGVGWQQEVWQEKITNQCFLSWPEWRSMVSGK